ncbi:MAG: hypothetical protein WA979_05445 [Pacificimonas sp.]
MELANLAFRHQEISQIATQTADLAARFRSSIDETDVTTLFLGSRLAMQVDDFDENGRIILSSITSHQPDPPNADGTPAPHKGHEIRWQRCVGGYDEVSTIGGEGDGLDTNGDPIEEIPTVDGMEVLWPNTVMFAEVTYLHRPLFGSDSALLRPVSEIFRPREIKYQAAFIARELSLQDITNTTDLADDDRATCPWVGDDDPPGGNGEDDSDGDTDNQEEDDDIPED